MFSARVTDDYTSIIIDIDYVYSPAIVPILKKIGESCDDIFVKGFGLFGSDAVCEFDANNYAIVITLAYSSQLTLDSIDGITVKENAFSFMVPGSNYIDLCTDVSISKVTLPSNPIYPVIDTSTTPLNIGVCSDIILDARLTTINIGNREPSFKWTFNNGNSIAGNEYFGSYVVIPNNILVSSHYEYNISVEVTTWFNTTSTSTVIITKTADVMGSLQLIGDQLLDVTKTDSLNVIANVKYDDTCINNMNTNRFEYTWYIKEKDTTLDVLSPLNLYLQAFNNDTISIPLSILQPGTVYQVLCDVDIYIIDVKQDTLSNQIDINYPWKPIQCKIKNGDQIVYDKLTINQIQGYIITLNGASFTFDSHKTGTLDHLSFKWDCIMNNVTQCNAIFEDSLTSLNPRASFADEIFTINDTYTYTFELMVSDTLNPSRSSCNTSFTIVFSNILPNSNDNTFEILDVSLTPIKDIINVNERLQLITTITGYTNRLSDFIYEYSELTNGIDINSIRINSDQFSSNLILDSNVLSSGTYQFQVRVSSINNDKYGIAFANIQVSNGPTIIPGSIVITPSCDNITYNSITEALDTKYSIKVSAVGDQLPLSYQYFINNNIIHVISPITTSFIDNIILPYGELTFKARVTDSFGAFDDKERDLKCNVNIVPQNVVTCFNIETYIQNYCDNQNNGLIITQNDKDKCILESLMIVTSFMHDSYGNTECSWMNLLNVINALNEYYSELCDDDLVIFVSNVLKLWFIEVKQTNGYPYLNDNNIASKLYSVLSNILDPCNLYDTVTEIEDVYTQPDSIVSNIPTLYYNNQEITDQLSNYLKNLDYYPILYEFLETIIGGLSGFNNIPNELVTLLEHTIYISQLLLASTSIVGEIHITDLTSINIFTTKLNNGTVEINIGDISVNLTTVGIEDNGDGLDGLDIVILNQNTPKNNNTVGYSCANGDTTAATINDNEIAITITSSNNITDISNLDGNFTIRFDNIDTSKGALCVWENTNTLEWSSLGCTTIILSETSIECNCNHLTTFSILSDLNNNNCELKQDLAKSVAIFVIFLILFTILFIFICFQMIRLCYLGAFFDERYRDKSSLVLCLAGVIAFLNILINALFIIVGTETGVNEISKSMKIVLDILLLSPFIIYIVIFSFVLFAWFVVVTSMDNNAIIKQERLKIALIVTFIVIFIYFIITLIFQINEFNGFKNVRLLFVIFNLLFTLIFGYYAYGTYKTVKKAREHMKTAGILSISTNISQFPEISNIYIL